MAQSNPSNLVQIYITIIQDVRGRPKRQTALQNQGLRVPLWKLISKSYLVWDVCFLISHFDFDPNISGQKTIENQWKPLRQKQQTSESSSLKQSTSTLSLRNFLKHLETSGERQNGKPLYLSALRPCPDLGGSVHVTRIWHAIDKKNAKHARMYTRYMYLPILDLLCNADVQHHVSYHFLSPSLIHIPSRTVSYFLTSANGHLHKWHQAGK